MGDMTTGRHHYRDAMDSYSLLGAGKNKHSGQTIRKRRGQQQRRSVASSTGSVSSGMASSIPSQFNFPTSGSKLARGRAQGDGTFEKVKRGVYRYGGYTLIGSACFLFGWKFGNRMMKKLSWRASEGAAPPATVPTIPVVPAPVVPAPVAPAPVAPAPVDDHGEKVGPPSSSEVKVDEEEEGGESLGMYDDKNTMPPPLVPKK